MWKGACTGPGDCSREGIRNDPHDGDPSACPGEARRRGKLRGPLATLRAAVNVTVRPLAQFSELLEHLDAMVAKGWVREGKSALDETEATWEITEKGKLQLRSA